MRNTIAQEYIQQGMQRGVAAMRQNIQEILLLRLDVPAVRFEAQLDQIDDLESLRLLARQAATVTDVAQFEQALEELP